MSTYCEHTDIVSSRTGHGYSYARDVTFLSSRGMTSVIGVTGLLLANSAVPALAASPTEGCGDAPVGGALSKIGDVCQIVFDVPGSTSWTVPASLQKIQAVITGGGAGAAVYGGGYAGDGGQVRYLTLTDPTPGAVLPVVVGAAGANSGFTLDSAAEEMQSAAVNATAGGASTFGSVTADGGTAPDTNDLCLNVGDALRSGLGAGKTRPKACAEIVSKGITPSLDVDSSGAQRLDLFSDYAVEHGSGGAATAGVRQSNVELQALTAGTGAGASVTLDGSITAGTAAGGSVIVRYTVKPQLANTGAGSTTLVLGLAATLLTLGAGFVYSSRRRSTSA